MDYKVSAVILAGGSGTRLSADRPKQYLNIGDRPVLAYSLDIFDRLSFVSEIIVVASEDRIDYCKTNIIAPARCKKDIKLTEGGTTRQESSLKGVMAASAPYIMIHDGARPFASAPDIERLYAKMLKSKGGAVLAVPVTDTIKEAEANMQIVRTVERDALWAALTPQAFSRERLIYAHNAALKSGFSGTDDASLLEYIGEKVSIVEGSPSNIKITTNEDLLYADFLVRGGHV